MVSAKLLLHTHTHTHTHIYIYILLYIHIHIYYYMNYFGRKKIEFHRYLSCINIDISDVNVYNFFL